MWFLLAMVLVTLGYTLASWIERQVEREVAQFGAHVDALKHHHREVRHIATPRWKPIKHGKSPNEVHEMKEDHEVVHIHIRYDVRQRQTRLVQLVERRLALGRLLRPYIAWRVRRAS
jgi:hypothetical protein